MTPLPEMLCFCPFKGQKGQWQQQHDLNDQMASRDLRAWFLLLPIHSGIQGIEGAPWSLCMTPCTSKCWNNGNPSVFWDMVSPAEVSRGVLAHSRHHSRQGWLKITSLGPCLQCYCSIYVATIPLTLQTDWLKHYTEFEDYWTKSLVSGDQGNRVKSCRYV